MKSRFCTYEPLLPLVGERRPVSDHVFFYLFALAKLKKLAKKFTLKYILWEISFRDIIIFYLLTKGTFWKFCSAT
jgi:hypothetical protein